MNVITKLTDRIENFRKENKKPCKSYATEAAAEKAVAKIAQAAAYHHGLERSANYVVFYNEAWGRWNAAVDLNELVNRNGSKGGYLGLVGSAGFYTY
jgi:hypothetical protein